MAVEQTGGLDDLLMGNVTEGSEETSEQIAARISSAQARLAAVKKDEKRSSKHDCQLAQVIKHLPLELIPFVSIMKYRARPFSQFFLCLINRQLMRLMN